MRVTLLQTDIKWGEPSANQIIAEEFLNKNLGSDVYVLPEMWPTGFATNPEGMAEDEAESLSTGSVAWMLRMAKDHNAAICGSIAIRTEAGKYANRMYFVMPDGQVTFYDKRHLFSPGGEDKRYCAGNERKIVSFRGFRFLLQVCYDLRFPVWSRCNNDYDAIIYVANWPHSRHSVWETLLIARAIENQCYVVGVNRTGADIALKYSGGSMVVNPYGKVAAQCQDGEEALTAELDKERLDRFRESFPALSDRDRVSIDY